MVRLTDRLKIMIKTYRDLDIPLVNAGLKFALVCSYLQVSQAAGQVKTLIFLVKIIFFPIYANNFCDAGQVPILRYFEA